MKLAIFGGKKINNKVFKYNTIGKEEISSVVEIMRNGELSGFVASPNGGFFGGEWVKKLETKFCKFFGVKYAIAVNSATSALYCMLMSSGIEPGDEVITSPYTMHATASSILQCGGIPVFADIESETYGLDPKSVEKKISNKTKAILAVNIFGHGAELLKLKKIAKKHKLLLLEDNSQAPAAKIENNQYTGTVGEAGVFSFNRHKTIQSGEGGILITNNKKIFLKSCLVRNHGECVVGPWKIKDISNTIGQNLRITEIQAAIAYHQFLKLTKLNKERVRLADRISAGISSIKGLSAPITRKNCTHAYYFYVMKYDEKKVGIKKEDFVKAINAEGYYLRSGYLKPLYLEPIFQKKICFGKKGFPFTYSKSNKKISYKKGTAKVCEDLNNNQVILTNIISTPYNIKDMDGFVRAIKKVIANKDQFKN